MTIQTEKSGSYICKGNVNAIENRAAVLTRNQFWVSWKWIKWKISMLCKYWKWDNRCLMLYNLIWHFWESDIWKRLVNFPVNAVTLPKWFQIHCFKAARQVCAWCSSGWLLDSCYFHIPVFNSPLKRSLKFLLSLGGKKISRSHFICDAPNCCTTEVVEDKGRVCRVRSRHLSLFTVFPP